MKKVLKAALSLLLVLALFASVIPVSVLALNPYIPLWEHLPDGEPKVFEDPDNPGKFRAYIFGSHDVRYGSYCGPDIRAWSAPVEDLTDWRDEGSVFTYYIDGQWDVMYAPDIVEIKHRDGTKEYYLYPHSRGSNRLAMVCKGPTPTGPFTAINMTEDGRRCVEGSIIGFDPALYIEYIDDPTDPDYEIGFRAYVYWGYAGGEKSWAAELDQNTMYSVRPGTQPIQYFMPCSSSYGRLNDPAGATYSCIYPDEDLTRFNFFEASSIRKVGNKYIMLYSGYSGPDYGLGSTNSALRYCYGDTPLGPWRSGGVLIDSRAPVLNQDGTKLQTTYSGHNTHGSLEEINGHWYCTYHRAPRGFGYARQPMVAPVKITWDEEPVAEGGKVIIRAFDPYAEDEIWTAKDSSGNEYTGAEVCSEGYEIFGLDPYKYYSAGYACYLSNTGSQQDTWDFWDNDMPITGVANGNIIGYKYFGFGGVDLKTGADYGLPTFEGTKVGNNTKFNLFLTPKTDAAFKINVWMDGPWDNDVWNGTKIAEIEVPADSAQEVTQFTADVSSFVDGIGKKHAIYLVAEGPSGSLFDLKGLGFSSDESPIALPEVPQIAVFIDGNPVTLPTTPVRSTNQNGLCDNIMYEATYNLPAGSEGIPVVTADCTDPSVKIVITQPKTAVGTAVVRFLYKGTEKNYIITINKSESIEGGQNVTSATAETVKYPQVAGVKQLPISLEGDWTAIATIKVDKAFNSSNEDVPVGANVGLGIRDITKGTEEATAEYASVCAEKLTATAAGPGARSIGRVNGTQSSSVTSTSGWRVVSLGSGDTYKVSMTKTGNSIQTIYYTNGTTSANQRAFNFSADFFNNAKLELFAQTPSEEVPVSATFDIEFIRKGAAYDKSEIADRDAIEAAVAAIGDTICVANAADPEAKVAAAKAAILATGAAEQNGVDIDVAYNDGQYVLSASKGDTALTFPGFGIFSEYAAADSDQYLVNSNITITAVTNDGVEAVKLANEYGKVVSCKVKSVVDNGDGSKTWKITTSCGTKGNRELSVLAAGADGSFADSGLSVAFKVVNMLTSAAAPAVTNVFAPASAQANESFVVKVNTSLGASKVGFFNESGSGIGKELVSCTDVSGTRVWTFIISIGSKGSRTINVKAADSDGAWGEQIGSFDIKIVK